MDRRPSAVDLPPLADIPALAARLSAGRPLVLLLDIDGTLSPIAQRPGDAVVPDDVREALRLVIARPGVHVAAVTGRGVHDAKRMVGLDGMWYLGNHGCETLRPDGVLVVDPRVEPYRPVVQQAAMEIAGLTRGIPGVLVEDKTWTLSIHFRLTPPELHERVAQLSTEVATRLGLRPTAGKMLVEVRHPVHVHKGTAAVALAETLDADRPEAVVFFAGDDVTDEDAFGELARRWPEAITLRVGDEAAIERGGGTRASLRLPSVAAMGDLVKRLARP